MGCGNSCRNSDDFCVERHASGSSHGSARLYKGTKREVENEIQAIAYGPIESYPACAHLRWPGLTCSREWNGSSKVETWKVAAEIHPHRITLS